MPYYVKTNTHLKLLLSLFFCVLIILLRVNSYLKLNHCVDRIPQNVEDFTKGYEVPCHGCEDNVGVDLCKTSRRSI